MKTNHAQNKNNKSNRRGDFNRPLNKNSEAIHVGANCVRPLNYAETSAGERRRAPT